jgi:hypothetical protein
VLAVSMTATGRRLSAVTAAALTAYQAADRQVSCPQPRGQHTDTQRGSSCHSALRQLPSRAQCVAEVYGRADACSLSSTLQRGHSPDYSRRGSHGQSYTASSCSQGWLGGSGCKQQPCAAVGADSVAGCPRHEAQIRPASARQAGRQAHALLLGVLTPELGRRMGPQTILATQLGSDDSQQQCICLCRPTNRTVYGCHAWGTASGSSSSSIGSSAG